MPVRSAGPLPAGATRRSAGPLTGSAARRPVTRHGALRALVVALGAFAGTLALVGPGAAPAAAAGYRYWSLWERGSGSNGWTYATQGPATARPDDGDVIGFRFAVSVDSGAATTPRGTPTFHASCDDTPAKSGSKRVAVVLDFGTAADAPSEETPPAPRTECARIPADSSAGDALAAVAPPLRYNSAALLCAIAGYPGSGCGEQVAGPADDHRPPRPAAGGNAADGGGGPSTGLIGGIAAVALLGVGAVWQARRHRA